MPTTIAAPDPLALAAHVRDLSLREHREVVDLVRHVDKLDRRQEVARSLSRADAVAAARRILAGSKSPAAQRLTDALAVPAALAPAEPAVRRITRTDYGF